MKKTYSGLWFECLIVLLRSVNRQLICDVLQTSKLRYPLFILHSFIATIRWHLPVFVEWPTFSSKWLSACALSHGQIDGYRKESCLYMNADMQSPVAAVSTQCYRRTYSAVHYGATGSGKWGTVASGFMSSSCTETVLFVLRQNTQQRISSALTITKLASRQYWPRSAAVMLHWLRDVIRTSCSTPATIISW